MIRDGTSTIMVKFITPPAWLVRRWKGGGLGESYILIIVYGKGIFL